MGMIEDKLFIAISKDDLEKVKNILNEDKNNINLKNDLKWTVLHACAFYGSEKVFNYILPQLKKARLNMFDKHKLTPFARAVTGPSEKIFNTLLNHPDIEIEKGEKKDLYHLANLHRYEPIFQLITKPEYTDRVINYFDNHSSVKVSWDAWYQYATWQNVLWALKIVFDNGQYKTFHDYQQRSGMRNAIRYNNTKIIEFLYENDNTIFEPTRTSVSPLSEGLKYKGRFAYLLGLIKGDLSETKRGYSYDGLIDDIRFFAPEIAKEYFEMVMKRDIFISETKILDMTNDRLNDITFFRSCVFRKDYNTSIMPIISQSERYLEYLPQTVQDVFLF